ncbi:hypothetical protein L9F63_026492 [Diploptera punctata]|uniref:Uncharacterized protein n=1 Tax=Diploptera punctata TaxID=6984 RepID=A0AAD8AK70_DIPPU|nr:hypothetical protein L9F63_026492 [Diploptera punctata]
MPITDVCANDGRARASTTFDDNGVAVVLVHDVKKEFLQEIFIYEPFPVETSLLEVLPDHLNAEIVGRNYKDKAGGSGTI